MSVVGSRCGVAPVVPPPAPARTGGVALEPLPRCLPAFAWVMAPWVLVLAGRRICVVAQHVPPLVRLVRAVRARNLWTAAEATGTQRSHSAPWTS